MSFHQSLLSSLGRYLNSRREAIHELRFLVGLLLNKDDVDCCAPNTSKLGHCVESLPDDKKNQLTTLVQRRILKHEPLAYIIGHTPFCTAKIYVRAPILVPRSDTECWTSKIAELIQTLQTNSIFQKDSKLVITDFYCGTGCVGIGLAKLLSKSEKILQVEIIGYDINHHAIQLAMQNSNLNAFKGLTATYVKADISTISGIPKTQNFHVIVANPPYLSDAEYELTEPGIKLWEDKRALVGGKTGWEHYEHIINLAHSVYDSNEKVENTKLLAMEIGAASGKITSTVMSMVKRRFQGLPHVFYGVWKDNGQHERCIYVLQTPSPK